MAKKKKKQRKNNQMPPLYWLDKLIYIALLAIAIGLLAAYFIFHFFTVEKLYFQEAGVVAFDRHMNVLWFFPAFFLLFSLILFIGDKFRYRYPIFGIPKFLYGPSKYPRIYPVFSKDKPKKKITPKMKRNTLILWSILVAFILTTLSTSFMGLFGRDCLQSDGSITKYNVFNQKTVHSSGAIKKITFSVNYQYSKANHSILKNRRYYVSVKLTTINEVVFNFRSTNFRNTNPTDWLTYMQQIKDNYPETMISYESVGINNVAIQYCMDNSEKALLYKLFNLEP